MGRARHTRTPEAVGRLRLGTQAIEAAGARLLYLPPYSPDFNPIENLWSKVKAALRAAAARTVETLGTAIDNALASISRQDCIGFFDHCGYTATARGALL